MPNLTPEQYAAYQARARLRSAKPEQAVRDDPLGPDGREEAGRPRLVVRITSRRARQLDPDNLIGGAKYLVDCLRYAGLIPDDRPQDIELVVRQELVSKELSCTIIEINPTQQ